MFLLYQDDEGSRHRRHRDRDDDVSREMLLFYNSLK